MRIKICHKIMLEHNHMYNLKWVKSLKNANFKSLYNFGIPFW